MKKMKTRWSKRVLVLLAAMIAIMSVNLQAFAATPVRLSGSPRDKKVIAIQNHKAKGMLNYITFEQEKGTAEFTKWKDGYGTVVKSKKCYACYKVVMKDNTGKTTTKYFTDGSMTMSMKKGRTYTVTVTYDAAKTAKKNSNWINGDFRKWTKPQSWMAWTTKVN